MSSFQKLTVGVTHRKHLAGDTFVCMQKKAKMLGESRGKKKETSNQLPGVEPTAPEIEPRAPGVEPTAPEIEPRAASAELLQPPALTTLYEPKKAPAR